jgi:hypothetical protein
MSFHVTGAADGRTRRAATVEGYLQNKFLQGLHYNISCDDNYFLLACSLSSKLQNILLDTPPQKSGKLMPITTKEVAEHVLSNLTVGIFVVICHIWYSLSHFIFWRQTVITLEATSCRTLPLE